jgi:GDP-L-fucose synthase
MANDPPMVFSLEGKRVFVAGDRGMVGRALSRRLGTLNCEVLTAPRSDVDLRRQTETEDWLAEARPDAVFIAAAKVGGILANATKPAEFLYDNLMIEANLIEAARRVNVKKLLFLGSSCIYPRMAPQPIREEALLTSALEPTNEWYAIAKIAGLKMCQAYRQEFGCDFISAMPTNLYGPEDNFDLESSHVLPACSSKSMVPEEASLRKWKSGVPVRRAGNSCTSMTLLMPASF